MSKVFQKNKNNDAVSALEQRIYWADYLDENNHRVRCRLVSTR